MARPPLQLLAELVAIPSHVSQPRGIQAVSEIIGVELASLGFERAKAAAPVRCAPQWAEQILSPEIGFDDLLDPFVWHRPGTADGELLILGDLDAALALEPIACRLTVGDGRAIGPAVADMKGGLVVLVEALRSLVPTGRPAPSVTVVLSADEQAGSLRSAETISQRAAAASWCICLECARNGGRLMRSRGHIGVGQLTATGLESHAGSAREEGINAITLLAKGLAALDGDGLSGRHATVTPTMVSGGRRRSMVPGSAAAVLDVRARDARFWEALEGRMQAALSAVDASDRLQLELFNHRPGLQATDRTEWFVSLVHNVGARLGVDVQATDSLAAGSSAFVDSKRIPVLDGMGPSGGALMTADEYIEVDSLGIRAELLAATIAELGAISARNA